MADTPVAAGLKVQQWDEEFFVEWIQGNQFADLMGEGENAIIQVKENLTKKKGDSVTFALVNRLTANATTGSDVLEGNEEDLLTRSHKITVAKRRHAVRVSESDEQFSAIGLRDASKPALKTWAEENTRDTIISALGSIDGVAYASATAGQKNTWLTNNNDRVLFGNAKANTVAGDHASSLANVDAVNDVANKAMIDLMKRMASTGSPKLRPVKDPGNGKRYYIAYMHPYAFRDFAASMDTVLATTKVEQEASKLFEGGDLMFRGVIVKELLDMPVYTGVGASAIDVAPIYLLGAQAVGLAIARRWKTVTKEFDYGDKFGTALDAIDGYAKLRFGTDSAVDTTTPKDNGVVTGYSAAVAD